MHEKVQHEILCRPAACCARRHRIGARCLGHRVGLGRRVLIRPFGYGRVPSGRCAGRVHAGLRHADADEHLRRRGRRHRRPSHGRQRSLGHWRRSTSIPANGYVLSGHDAAREWLLQNTRVGTTVALPGNTATPTTPTATTPAVPTATPTATTPATPTAATPATPTMSVSRSDNRPDRHARRRGQHLELPRVGHERLPRGRFTGHLHPDVRRADTDQHVRRGGHRGRWSCHGGERPVGDRGWGDGHPGFRGGALGSRRGP